MAIEKVINIVANTGKAIKEVGDLFNKLVETEKKQLELNESADEMGDAYKSSSKEATKAVEKIGDSAKKQNGVMQRLGKSVQAVGTSLKALGIGLVIALVAKFTQVLSENKTIVDTVGAVSNTLGIVINQLINSFVKIASKINEATGGFNALGEVIGSLIKIAFNQLKSTLLTLEAGFTGLKLAYENVFGDEEGVKKAEKRLAEIGKKLIEINADNIKQGKNIINNIGEAVTEVVDGVSILATEGTKAIGEIDLKRAYAQGKAMQEAKNNFELLALQQQRLQLQYQNEAELLRQIRDDDSKSITERLKANDELGNVLTKQFEAESKTIKARISGLQNEQKLLGFNKERQNEIYQLQTDLIDVEERLNGARSEQLTNTNSLLKEQRDIIQMQIDGENERFIKKKEFEAEQEKTELARLEKQKELLNIQAELDLADLERKRLLYKEDTAAREEAEQEYLNKKQEIDNKLIENTKKTAEEKKAIELAVEEAKNEGIINIANSTLSILSGLANEGSALSKGLAVAQATMNTYQGITSALSATSVIPDPLGTNLKFINAGLIGVQGALNVRKILATKVQKGGGGGSFSPANIQGGGGVSAPSFNLVGGTGTNQIATALGSQNKPIQAFVVGSAVSSQQELDRNAVNNASL